MPVVHILAHVATFVAASLVALAAYYHGTRRGENGRRRIMEMVAPHAPRPGRRSVFVKGQGAACPVCGALVPFYNFMPMPPGRLGLADHVLTQHPESDLADDVRYIRAHAWRTQSLS